MGYQKEATAYGFRIRNDKGPILGCHEVPVIEKDGLAFKNLAGRAELLPYEDWRLPARERAGDLAKRLSVEDIAGLMLYSSHQSVPFRSNPAFHANYGGKPYAESGAAPHALTDEQKVFLKEGIRHVLLMDAEDAGTAARWNNEMQGYVEGIGYGIPANTSSDPRHGVSDREAEYKSSRKNISKWPQGLGLAAAFSKEMCREFAEIASKEYRAMGITTALSPQADLGTEPRWMRIADTFGPDPELVADYVKAYCDGMQTTEGSADGWGLDSVVTMVKHWPGGGTCEGGRDAHYPFGKYAVYPGNHFEEHKKPFLKGAFALDGRTGKCASVMPYYSISYGQDQTYGETMGNSYSKYMIQDLLRNACGYDGVVCTDWGITGDPDPEMDSFGSRCYGVEELSEAERHLKAIMNGVDQFGGNNRKEPVLKAYEIGCERYGETAMRKRMEESAIRLLINMFRLGLFENPYLDPEESERIVACDAFRKAGFEAQLRSVVLLKNKKNCLPLRQKCKVYIPKRKIYAHKDFFRRMQQEVVFDPVAEEVVNTFFIRVEKPEDADAAIVFLSSPVSDGYAAEDVRKGGNGYLPVSLQYRPYRAEHAREMSIAGGDFREKDRNRSYQGKMGYTANEPDLDNVLKMYQVMEGKPVIVCLSMNNPTIVGEFEPFADAILADFGCEKEAIFEILTGKAVPSGRLPVILPHDMESVEKHAEDDGFDLVPYQDEEGNAYDFGYGRNFHGVLEKGSLK